MASQTRSLLHDVMQKEMTEPIEMPNNLDTAITFKLCEQSGVTWIETPTPDPINSLIIYEKPKLVVHEVFRVLLSDVKRLPRRRRYTQVGAKILSILGVEEYLQAPILGKLFQVIEAAVPGVPITVFLTSVIVNLLNSESDAGMGDVTLRSWDRERPVDDESVIDSLEATIRETPLCAICLEGLDHYGVVEYGTDHQPSMSTTTCFPCSHLYHRNCITQWLEKNPSCPLCRCKMPDVEAVGDAGMGDVTLPLGGQERPVDGEVVIDTGTRVNFIPATESSIEALEQVRLDSLETTIRETWLCDIFWEGRLITMRLWNK
ncbi:uncharacterized protein LOC133741945 [Rosa rugosa]|uniref:uncharacterized protein LOC133741945 n=1 Tax=Rosa rugosa TaxID=74645 RepID=UPI002B410FCB|nr:uncharacterized protein LOC133741945 [Rosa rugosa]